MPYLSCRQFSRVALILLLHAFVGLGLAQAQEATLRVIALSEEEGQPLPGAAVVLSTAEGDTLGIGATDLDGLQEFRGLPPGEYDFSISHVGYETYEHRLTLEEGTRVYRAQLALSEEMLDELVVEALRGSGQPSAGLQRMTAADLDRLPTPGLSGDLAAYMQAMPSVVTAGDRGGELYIRGGTPSQNLALIDDIPIIKPFHISNLFSAFPSEAIQGIDMYSGGFGAEYMGATSSVMDVSLRQGNMRSFSGQAGASPYLASAMVEGPIQYGLQSFLGLVRYSVIDQTGPSLTGESVPLQFYDMTGRYTVRLRNLTCSVTGIHTRDEGEINPDRNMSLAWTNAAVGGRCLLFGSDLDYTYDLRLGYSRFENTEGRVGAPERLASVDKAYLKLDREQDLVGLNFRYGFRWFVNRYFAEVDDRFTMWNGFELYSTNVQLYTGTRMELGDRLTITPSLGAQITLQRITPAIEPRLRLSYRPDGTNRQSVHLALGKYNQMAEGITDERDAGTVFTVWHASESGEPLPQSLQMILGYSRELTRGVEATVEGYAMRRSYIPVSRWTPVARLETRTALANGHTYGLDVRLEVGRGPLYLFLGYGLSRVTYEAAVDDLGAWIEEKIFSYAPPHDQRHQLNVVANYNLGGFTTSARWEFGSGRPYTKVHAYDFGHRLPNADLDAEPGTAMILYHRPYAERLPMYHRLDLSVERSFELTPAFALDLQAGAINLYDRRNVFYLDVRRIERVDQMPLLPYISLRARFN